MKSRLLLGAVFFVMVTVLGAAVLQRPANTVSAAVAAQPVPATSGTPSVAIAKPAPAPTPTPTPAPKGLTMAQVAAHNSASSCWTAINGNVYDLTNWINQHPGGPDVIAALCGTDGSAAFNAQHGGQRRPANELSNFLLGPLAS